MTELTKECRREESNLDNSAGDSQSTSTGQRIIFTLHIEWFKYNSCITKRQQHHLVSHCSQQQMH